MERWRDHFVWPTLRWLARFLLVPGLVYLFGFILLTWPLIHAWRTHFFADSYDGLQNVWNLWWVNKAVVQLHQSPWHTGYLHYPRGTTLIGHTLNPFNGFVGIILRPVLPLGQTYNLILTMTFVLGGVFAFGLAHYLTGRYWASIVAGFVFTFSSYHFGHAEGHLQLASLQFIPLFLHQWLRLLERPTLLRAIGTGTVLGLLVLCDYYYTLYCAVAGGIVLAWNLQSLTRRHLIPLAIFLALGLLFVGPFAVALAWQNLHDPLLGAHRTQAFSTDLPAPLIPSAHWRFGWLTEPYWSKLPGNPHEHSVYLGIAAIGLAAAGIVTSRGGPRSRSPRLWGIVGLVFLILSFGPALNILGIPRTGAILPYAWLEWAFPPLKLSGMPVRMMVMVSLATSILVAYGLAALDRLPDRFGMMVRLAVLGLMLIELWPRPIPQTAMTYPTWAAKLRDLHGTGGVICWIDQPDPMLLYCQTLHEKPMALGYISRAPRSVLERDDHIVQLLREGDFQRLRDEFGFRYFVTDHAARHPELEVVHEDGLAIIYDLRFVAVIE